MRLRTGQGLIQEEGQEKTSVEGLRTQKKNPRPGVGMVETENTV